MAKRLKVTSVERFHLCDDTAENPNVIGCELTVSGIVDQDIATAALREAARRHPMSSARLSGKHWILDDRNADQLYWLVVDPHDDNDSPELRRIDPKTDAPGLFILQVDGDRTRLSFRTHHAAIDGGGGLQYVADWLLCYHRISSQTSTPRSRKTDLATLERRNHLQLLGREFIGKLWIQPIAMLGAFKFMFRRIQPIVEPSTNDRSMVAEKMESVKDFQLLTTSIQSTELELLKQKASECKATVNELVLRAIFLAIHEFRKRNHLHKQGGMVEVDHSDEYSGLCG